MKKSFGIIITCVFFLTGCSDFSGNQYVFYGKIQNVQERIKHVDVSEYVHSNCSDNGTMFATDNTIYDGANKTFYSTGNKRIQPVRECIYTIKLRNGKIVTISQENGPTVLPNQNVAVHYYPSGIGEVIPVKYNAVNGNMQVVVPYDSEKNKIIIEV